MGPNISAVKCQGKGKRKNTKSKEQCFFFTAPPAEENNQILSALKTSHASSALSMDCERNNVDIASNEETTRSHIGRK